MEHCKHQSLLLSSKSTLLEPVCTMQSMFSRNDYCVQIDTCRCIQCNNSVYLSFNILSAITGSDLTLSSWFLTFISGQSQYNQSTSCISMFIINDTTLEDTEYLILELTPANRTAYLPFRNVANITINEDQNDSMYNTLLSHYDN